MLTFWRLSGAALAVCVLSLMFSGTAAAGPIPCDPATCGWSISVDGVEVMSGAYDIDADGNVSLPSAVQMTGADFDVSITDIGGNVDPEITFGLGATNNSGGPKAFAFAFSLPLGGFSGLIDTEAALSMTLTAPTTNDLNLAPTSGTGFVADSQDIRFSPFSSVDKGVDIGGALFDAAGGLATVTNELKTSQILLSGAGYDVMSVVIGFVLDDNGGVGMSGRVTQTLVPEPGTAFLMGLGLVALSRSGRRR